MRADHRALRVTAGLAAAGALVGALAGALSVVAAFILRFGPRELLKIDGVGVLLVPAAIGGVFGFIVGPAVAWTFLRRVSIGRMLALTSAGTIIGAALGELAWPLNPYSHEIPGIIRGALAGFAIGVVLLRFGAKHDKHLDAAV